MRVTRSGVRPSALCVQFNDPEVAIYMTRTVSVSQFRPEFSDFLFAPVGNDRNGMLLSVLSALARQNVDPWQEAAELAQLPRETAIQRLLVLIGTPPGGAPLHQDTSTIAAALLELLPSRQHFETPSRTQSIKAAARINLHLSIAFIVMLFLAVIFGANYIAASSQPPASGVGANAPASGLAPPITTLRKITP